MKPESADKSFEREIQAKRELWGKGWTSLGCWRFMAPGGTIHDLSAADLSQVDWIEREGLFIAA